MFDDDHIAFQNRPDLGNSNNTQQKLAQSTQVSVSFDTRTKQVEKTDKNQQKLQYQKSFSFIFSQPLFNSTTRVQKMSHKQFLRGFPKMDCSCFWSREDLKNHVQ